MSGRRNVGTTTEGCKATVKRIRLWDKIPALEFLAKHLGMFDADNGQRRPKVIVKNFASDGKPCG